MRCRTQGGEEGLKGLHAARSCLLVGAAVLIVASHLAAVHRGALVRLRHLRQPRERVGEGTSW